MEKWGLAAMGRRTAAATSIAEALREIKPRTDTIPFIRVPYSDLLVAHPDWETRDDSNHHEALQVFAQHLQSQMGGVRNVQRQAGDAAQRMSNLADQIRSGVLGVPAALRGRI
jgi:hypothetical protein